MTANKKRSSFFKCMSALAMFTLSSVSFGEALSPVVDNFNAKLENNLGLSRQYLNDTLSGGGTRTKHTVDEGILYFSGDIMPPRGQPGWASTVLPLDAKGIGKDASQFDGIRMVIKVNAGNVSISANSTEISNFDYHAAPVIVKADGRFHEVKIPFDAMKRTWSEQTKLNTQTIASLSITAYGLQKGNFDFALDEIGFYKK